MGLLDDAIREHLELKRRRGADPSEVDRLEREALGPVRRGPHDAADLMIDEESAAPAGNSHEEEVTSWEPDGAEAAPFDHTAESQPPAAEWPEPESPPQFDAPSPPSHEPEPAPGRDRRSDLPRHHEIAEEWEAHERQALTAEPAGSEPDEPAPAPPPPPAATPSPGAAAPSFEEETAEYQVETDEEFEEPRAGEDVLEETPDFLQDTPDHDRLWFEQRPPRDFDFDG